jgi:NDP-sugar pyrophosphorylase family protein
MLNFHRKHQAILTVGVKQYDLEVPYGVMECIGPYVQRIREKPIYDFLVNAGIYLLEPSTFQYIPNGEKFNMTNLMQSLINDKQTVISFPIIEYWLDIGQHIDYEKAQHDIKTGRYRS